MILKSNKVLETFTKSNCKETNQKEFKVERVIKRKAINKILNKKAMSILLTLGLTKMT